MIQRRLLVVAASAFVAVWLAATPSAEAAKLIVASNGADSASCGAASSPCRTIGQAIGRAAAGDTIEVGPGIYGDGNGDGDFLDAGEEASAIGTGCNCVVHVDKPVTLIARDGPGATVVDAGAVVGLNVIRVDAAGVTIGKRKQGFTLRGGGGDGIEGGAGAARLTVAGNILLANGANGLQTSQDGTIVVGNRAIRSHFAGFNVQFDDGLIRDNVAVDCEGNGFLPDCPNLLIGNAAIANGQDGFGANGEGCVFKGNVATGNADVGFDLGENNLLIGNVANGNGRGIDLEDGGNVLTKNVIVGNRGVGVLVRDGLGTVVTKNSIYGNHVGTDDVAVLPAANCGVAVAVTDVPLLTQNFWGAATGPGDDPADAVCLLGMSPEPQVEPVATKEIKVKVKAAQ